MKTESDTIIGMVLFILALISGCVGLVYMLIAMSGTPDSARYLMAGIGFFGSGLTLWWMSTVADLLARIAARSEQSSDAKAHAPNVPKPQQSKPKKVGNDGEVPSYRID